MGENTEKIICSCCGKVLSASQKFCPDCGTPLGVSSAQAASGAGTAKADSSAERNPLTQKDPDAQPVNIYPDDSGLKLMINCCDTVGPLAGGITQSSETVLYYDEKTGRYQVHKYASAGYGSKKHEGYYTTKEHAARVMPSIDADAVLKSKNMPAPAGGSCILIFRNEKDEMIRTECSTGDLSRIKSTVEKLLSEAVKPENRIVPEEAKNWKKFVVSSTGMSMDSCFNYDLERIENGKVTVSGNCFVSGNAHARENRIELSKTEAAELEKIPLGLMLSDIAAGPAPVMALGFAGTIPDGDRLSVSITYANGKRDIKIPDKEMIRELDKLMKRII